jgi:hypothetical protein
MPQAPSGLRVESEDHAGGTEVGTHHLHHADGERYFEMVEALVDSVVDRTIGEQAREAASARIQQYLLPAHVEVGLVLSREAGGRQVLGGRR